MLRYFKSCQEKDEKSSHWHNKYTEILDKYSALQKQYSILDDKLEEKWSKKYAELQKSNQKKDLDVENLKGQIDQLNNQIIILQKASDFEKLTSQVSKDIEKVRQIIKSCEILKNPGLKPDNLKYKTRNLPDCCSSTQSLAMVLQEIQIPGLEPFNATCHSDKDEGPGWMLVARKIGFSDGFNHTYEEFKSGFSPSYENLFIGLERLHVMTNRRPHQVLLVDKDNSNDESYILKCDNFALGDENEGYNLKKVEGCSGDTLLLTRGAKFSSFDRDVDGSFDNNWAKYLGIGWWYSSRYVFSKY